MMYKLLLLVLAAACLNGGPGLPAPARVSDRNAKEVRRVFEVSSRADWQTSGFYRIGDETIDVPLLLALANDGTLCILDGRTWATLRPGQQVACRVPWRNRRA
jgi:hypothetical protein